MAARAIELSAEARRRSGSSLSGIGRSVLIPPDYHRDTTRPLPVTIKFTEAGKDRGDDRVVVPALSLTDPAGADEEVEVIGTERKAVDPDAPPVALAEAALLLGGTGRSGGARAGAVGHGCNPRDPL